MSIHVHRGVREGYPRPCIRRQYACQSSFNPSWITSLSLPLLEAAEILLDAGARLDSTVVDNVSPLHRSGHGFTVLHLAQSERMTKMLVRRGAKLSVMAKRFDWN